MAELTGRFSSNRSLQEYLGSYYLKAAAAYQARSENKGEWGRQFNVWKQAFMEKWKGLYFDQVRIETGNGQHRFTVTIFLNGISPGDIAVELYAEGEKDGLPFRQIMEAVNDPGNEGKQTYTINLPDKRPSSDHTPRIIPVHPDIYIPLELGLILWQH